jgi:RNA polymerase sigma factor (sigma-70 family)
MPAPISDREAIAIHVLRCKRGNERSKQALVGLYSRSMLNVCMRILNDLPLAQDTLQESFLSAFENIYDYEENLSFGSWLKRIVINRSYNVLRKNNLLKKNGWTVVPLGETDLAEEEPTAAEEFYKSLPDSETIRQCIQLLPDAYRTSVTLYYFENYSHHQIAELQGIEISSSRSQLNRAIQMLDVIFKQKFPYLR